MTFSDLTPHEENQLFILDKQLKEKKDKVFRGLVRELF